MTGLFQKHSGELRSLQLVRFSSAAISWAPVECQGWKLGGGWCHHLHVSSFSQMVSWSLEGS